MKESEPADLGATAVGLFYLGEDYLRAAVVVDEQSKRGLNAGPQRLLCLHACELFLKAFLRERGYAHDLLRRLMHDLSATSRAVVDEELDLKPELRRGLATVAEINAYVDSRYEAGSESGPYSSFAAVRRLAEGVRDCVRPTIRLLPP